MNDSGGGSWRADSGNRASDIELTTDKKDEPTFSESVTDPQAYSPHVGDALKGTPVAGTAYKTITESFENFSNAQGPGELAGAAGQLVADGAGFAAECGIEITSFVMDPVNWLVSNGLDFLLELIQPLQDALHAVTGDGPSLGEASDNFGKIGESFVELANDFVQTGDKALKDWNEDAGAAAKNALARFAVGIQGVGSSAGSVAETLKMWSMVMTIIEETVKAIISELVSFLIYIWLPALAASVISLGSSVASAMSASIAKGAHALSKITAKLGKLGRLLDKFMDFLVKWSSKLAKSSEELTKPVQLAMRGGATKSAGRSAQVAASKDAAKDVLKGSGGTLLDETSKEVLGTSPDEIGKGGAHAVKGGIGATKKLVEHAETDAKGNIGGGQETEEARDNLKM